MFFFLFITSRYIAVKRYLIVYWLLPLSIVASFKKNRRFFCLAPTILLESIDDSFAEHRWILGPVNQLHFQKESFPAFSRLFFSSSTESQTTWQKSYYINRHQPQDSPDFCLTKRSCQRYQTQVFCRAVPEYVLALLKNGHQWDVVSPVTGTLQDRKR